MSHQFSKGDIVRETRTGVELEVIAPDTKDKSLVLCRLAGGSHTANFKTDSLELVQQAKAQPGERSTGGPVLDIKS